METMHLTRYEMSQLLLSLKQLHAKSPKAVLQEAWLKSHKDRIEGGKSVDAFMETALPIIFEKVMKINSNDPGLSLNDIVSLGMQIEYNHFAITAVQNWVKRDLKDLIGPPRVGKKYSLEQAAIIFIIEDLRAALDMESIRKLLGMVFRHFDDHTSMDRISPLALYAGYSTIFEEMDQNNDQMLDMGIHGKSSKKNDHMIEPLIKNKANQFATQVEGLEANEREAISHLIVIALMSVQATYFQTLARRFFHASLFWEN